jgi:hypothetical protein
MYMQVERELALSAAERLARLGFEPAGPFRGLSRLFRSRRSRAARAHGQITVVRAPARRALRES